MDEGASDLRSAAFLSEAAKKLLDDCEPAIFEDWQKNFGKDKSLANILKRTLLADLDALSQVVEPSVSANFKVKRGFHHRASSSLLFVDMFGEFNEGVPDFLMITQTKAFKEKFLYDSSTMTIDTLTADLREFITKLRLTRSPRIFFLVLSDLPFATSVWQKGNNKYLKLEHDQHT